MASGSRINLTWYNKHFRFVYTPILYEPKKYYLLMFGYNRERFLVGAGQLKNYIGAENAETVLKTAQNLKKDKTTVKFRKCGKIEIYVK